MKNTILLLSLLMGGMLHAQTDQKSEPAQAITGLTQAQMESLYLDGTFVKDYGHKLVLMDSISIKEGDEIQIYLPTYGKDFLFVERKKGMLNAKLIGAAADVVGTGAVAVGLGTGNLSTMSKAFNVMNKASAVSYGADAIDKISDLPISKEAKRMAGEKMEVVDWENDDGSYIITAQLVKKKYLINLEGAYLTGEVRL